MITDEDTIDVNVAFVAPVSSTPYTATTTLAHGLDYAPASIAFLIPPVGLGFTGFFHLPWTAYAWDTGTSRLYPAAAGQFSVDGTNLYASVTTNSAFQNGLWQVHYFLLAATAN